MCLFNPKAPTAPPPPPEMPPPPPVPTTPQTPTTVRPTTSRAEARQRGRMGTSSLSIPLSTGGSQPSGTVNLNIGK